LVGEVSKHMILVGALVSAWGCARAILPTAAEPSVDGFVRPALVSGEAPSYTKEARDARVEGTVVAKCVMTTEGTLEQCKIHKSLPHMDEAVLATLPHWKYTPATYEGRPLTVEYVVRMRLVPP
jgi:TonB family protein